jgi:phage/plasmid-like protein (TIGR03299 family)
MQFFIANDLNWTVSKRPMTFNYDGQSIEIPNKFAVVRDDNQEFFGVVGPDYEVVQNSSLLHQVTALESEGLLTRSNTGYLDKGARVFVQSKFAEEFVVAGDETKAMVSLLNGHGSGTATRIGLTCVRVICGNTFAMAMKDLDVRITHRPGANEQVLTNTYVRDYVNERMKVYAEHMETLASTECSKGKFDTLIKEIYRRSELNKMKEYNELEYLFRNGAGNSGSTLADVVNAVTEFNTHRSSKRSERRYVSNQFGSAATVSRRAFQVALAAV